MVKRPKQRGDEANGPEPLAAAAVSPEPAVPQPAAPPTPVAAVAPTPAAIEAPAALPAAAVTINDVRRQWARVLEDIKRVKMICHALLIDGTPLDVAGDTLIVGLRSAYTFHMESLNRPENRDIVEGALNKILATPLRFRCQLYDAPAPDRDGALPHANGGAADAGAVGAGGVPPAAGGSLVDRARELFGAQIVEEP